MRTRRRIARSQDAALRCLLDANVNRAFEGLRVCEDLVRFCFDFPTHFRRLRALRHALSTAVRSLPLNGRQLVIARGSRRDPGRRARPSALPATHPRGSIEHLLLINLQRTKEALRVLEEGSRLVAPRQTRAFQRLRFRVYHVERELLISVAALRDRRRARGRPA